MTDQTEKRDEKKDALLAMVRRNAEAAARDVDAEAVDKARDIVARAHAEAREKMHTAIQKERREGVKALERQRARIETAKRQTLQDKEHAFLDAVWERLPGALRTRWRDPSGREAWLGAIVDWGMKHLRPGAWEIEHPKDWAPSEFDPYKDQVHGFSGAAVQFVAVPDLDAGIRIKANGAVVDGGIAGASADTAGISAMLLAELLDDVEGTS